VSLSGLFTLEAPLIIEHGEMIEVRSFHRKWSRYRSRLNWRFHVNFGVGWLSRLPTCSVSV
jgi:hypothetical protein